MRIYIHVPKARAEKAVGGAIQSGMTHHFLSWQLLLVETKHFGGNILDKSHLGWICCFSRPAVHHRGSASHIMLLNRDS